MLRLLLDPDGEVFGADGIPSPTCSHCGAEMEIEGQMMVACHCPGSERAMRAELDRTRVWQEEVRAAEERLAKMRAEKRRKLVEMEARRNGA